LPNGSQLEHQHELQHKNTTTQKHITAVLRVDPVLWLTRWDRHISSYDINM